jgi:pyridoxine 4-dehydrogenase
VLAELQNRGLIRHLGVSNVTPYQLREVQTITNVVCVQNFYNVANRNDDEFIDLLAKQGIVGSFYLTTNRSGSGDTYFAR